jgi:hypothetical protein
VTNIEYYGGSTDQRIRFAENRKLLHGPFYFAEYGSANRIDGPNTDIVDWCMDAWFRGACRVLPWNTIGTPASRLRIVNLLHSFGTGGMEKGIAAVVHTRNWGRLDGNTERPVTVTLVTRKTYILTENAMPGKLLILYAQ